MRPIFVANDVHIGTIRSAGTTPQTAYQLRLDLIEGYRSLLGMANGSHVLLNGDLFDRENVPMSDLYAAWQVTRDWLLANPDCELVNNLGNHDSAKTSTTFTSFDLFVKLLESEFGARVITGRGGFAWRGHWVLGHVQNQDILNLELTKVPPCEMVFMHCNFDNFFAAQSDNSLNLSKEQAQALPVKHVIIGHEHQRSEHLDGKVILPGNQIPSSVSDCLGNSRKYALKIHPDNRIEWIETCDMADVFLRVDWRELAGVPPRGKAFVRVEGTAEAHEAADVVAAISAARKGSDALVLTNAVKVAGGIEEGELQVSLEDVKSFRVLDALLELLTAEEREVVQGLLETNGI